MLPRSTLQRARVLALGLLTTGSLVAAGPCDIYSSGGTPCVAAHSTTRALYNAFTGSLYQVKRGSDGTTTTIVPLSAGGVANSAHQDTFCAGTTCTITIIYDQSGRNNHLTPAPGGSAGAGPGPNGYDNPASAIGAPVTLNGKKAYGVFIPPGTGYRNNAASGIATQDASEGMYAVFDGTHYNGGCCFDYGNAETHSDDTGAGHMEAIYFGDITVWGSGAGKGPWIMADLENGLFSGSNAKVNSGDPSINFRFITAAVKGQQNNWAIHGGNAQSGGLSSYWNGVRPSGYNPMKKEGAIILGIGGDNSHGAQGTFYEGVMTSGFPSDATENSVQANIVAAKYAAAGSQMSVRELTAGSSVSLRATTSSTNYVAHSGSAVNMQAVSSANTTALKQQASWIVHTGLGNSACSSFESVDTAGSFLRHSDFTVVLGANDDTKLFAEEATFCFQKGLNGQGNSVRAWSQPTRYLQHSNNDLSIARNDGASTFNDEVSFVVGTAFA